MVARLCEHFARDDLTMEEFERRLDLANAAPTRAELEQLVADMPALPVPAAPPAAVPTQRPSRAPATHEPTGGPDLVIGVLGAANRRGGWRPGHRVVAMGVMGGVVLDFREAVLTSEITDVLAIGFMGGIELIVPPDLPVEVHGIGIMGGVNQPEDSRHPVQQGVAEEYDGEPRLLRVRAFGVMGGVDVQVRLRGESKGDAKRRVRQERRELRREQKRRRQRGGDA